MRDPWRSAGVAVLVAAALAFPARSAAPLTLPQAVGAALDTHPSLAVARAGRAEAHAALGQARAAWLPRLSAAGSVMRYEEPMMIYPIHRLSLFALPAFDETLLQGGVTLTYTLFDGAARIGGVRQARALEEAAGSAGAAAEQALIARVAVTYLAVLNSREILAAHDHRLTALAAEQRRVEDLLLVGRAAEIQILQTAAALANAVAERVRAAGALELAEQELARLMDAPVDSVRAERLTPFTLADSVPPSREALVAEALAANPLLDETRRRLRAAEAGMLVARSARWPALTAVGNYLGWADGSTNDVWEWNAGLQVAWPLFSGGAISKGVERARAARQGAGGSVELAELEVCGEVDRALTALDEARARTVSLEAAVAASAEVVRIQKLALEAGSATESDYLEAEADLLAARATLADARQRDLGARIELARVTGRLSREWIAQQTGAVQ